MTDQKFLEMAVKQFSLSIHCIHGVGHWIKVHENGFRLADKNRANKRVIRYFAFLHDCRRLNNGSDHSHGPRAADYARKHRDKINLTDKEFKLLTEALSKHTTGCSYRADITVQTCIDADRLDIGRVGCIIDPAQLYTKAAIEEAKEIRRDKFGYRERSSIYSTTKYNLSVGGAY
jgi:uncharacterized protein